MDKEKLIERLKKIKALAEQGIGGEKEGAIKLYNDLLSKYELDSSEIDEEKIERHWLRYDDFLDKKLITYIFYKVTGSNTYWEKTDKRKRLVGTDCTEFELQEIIFYYQFYKVHLRNEADIFYNAFASVNYLYPDPSARLYKEDEDDDTDRKIDLNRMAKIHAMAQGIDRKTPNKMIEDKENNDGE